MNYKDTDLSRACFESSRSSLDLYRHLKTYCSASIACLLVTPNTLLSCSWSREKTRTTTYPSHPTCYFTIFLLIYFIPKGQEPNFYLSSDGSLCVCYDCPCPSPNPFESCNILQDQHRLFRAETEMGLAEFLSTQTISNLAWQPFLMHPSILLAWTTLHIKWSCYSAFYKWQPLFSLWLI